ncbi:MAG: HAMP domain-containing protein [Oscillospiraceae bacterium]|nr:HAMP domain-containing protein [Oscillospiraceae bacterium]
MLRSLHMKLVMIMVLLILSLMTVVGAFLMNSVVAFYLNDFYAQVNTVFSDRDVYNDMTTQTPAELAGETSGVEGLDQVLSAYAGAMGVNGSGRNYYILDETGRYLAGTDDEYGPELEFTRNLMRVIEDRTQVGDESNLAADYMDVAIPIDRGGEHYIVYIRDDRNTVDMLNSQLFTLIVEALVFGLVISILLSFLLSKTMVTSIRRLTDGAERVANGDFSHKIEVTSQDEIGVLTNTFNDMAGQLEDTLQQVENERNKLDTLFLHMNDGVVAFDSEGRVIHSNPAAAAMLCCEIGADSRYEELFPEQADLSSVLSAPDYLEGELEREGRYMELLLAPIDRENQAGALVVVHDMTEKRKNEEMRREFVANVSHELRTPLTNIRSYAETLAENVGDLPPKTEQKFLGVILNESDRMTHIVQDLLTLSRFDSGHNELKLGKFSFTGAINDMYNAVYLEAQRHDHTIALKLEPGLPEIVADRERILQVMMNIVSNSIKYTPNGGHIVISAGRVDDRVWMEVADNGIGIPKEDRARIFERFYRVDKARSRESGGTGLGLSIAKEIIDRHRGLLTTVDKEEPGLTLRMELNVEGPGHE